MYLISAEGYTNAGVRILIVKKLVNVEDGLGVQDIYDLVLKEIYGIYKTNNLTKEQIKKCKMIEKEIFEKYDNLS